MDSRSAHTGIFAVTAVTALLACSPSPAIPASSAATSTRVIHVAPVDTNSDPVDGLIITRAVHGHCSPGSDSVPGPTYRCFFGNFIADPCWADESDVGSVLCMTQPWTKTAIRVYVPTLEPTAEAVPKSLNYPWGVELTDGEKCLAQQGAHDQFDGRVVDYGCGGPDRHVLLRGMHRTHPLWSFDSATWTGRKYLPGKREQVRIAWYGGPS